MTRDGWPRGPKSWIIDRTLYVSIPFTWNLPIVLKRLRNQDMYFDEAIVGGPATRLMPDYFKDLPHVEVGRFYPRVMQIVNPLATKTTTGCIRSCKFCAVPKIEGQFKELEDWPDLPIITDNNLLASSGNHFNRVMDRLERHRGVDFNQGLDARLLNGYHAARIGRLHLRKRGARLSLDNMQYSVPWAEAVDTLLHSGLAKRNISSYAIAGLDADPSEAWERCKFIESFGVRALPMWFHELDAMKNNVVTEKQKALGWTDYERRRIMQWFYQHKKAVA